MMSDTNILLYWLVAAAVHQRWSYKSVVVRRSVSNVVVTCVQIRHS